jgi:hypothetical protein
VRGSKVNQETPKLDDVDDGAAWPDDDAQQSLNSMEEPFLGDAPASGSQEEVDGVKVSSWKPPGEPQFVPEGIKNVTVPAGETAFLNCRVRNLGNKTVSAFRAFLDLLYKRPVAVSRESYISTITNANDELLQDYCLLLQQ